MNEENGRQSAGIRDSVIDTIARQMTDAEPRADLRARVLARIEARIEAPIEERPRRRVAWTWVAVPVAAAALVVLAIALLPLLRSSRQTPPSTTVVAAEPRVPRGAAPGAPFARPRPVATRKRAGADRPTLVRETIVVAAPSNGAVTVDALRSLAPIAVAPVQPPAVQVANVSVAPLADLSPIPMESLSPPRERD